MMAESNIHLLEEIQIQKCYFMDFWLLFDALAAFHMALGVYFENFWVIFRDLKGCRAFQAQSRRPSYTFGYLEITTKNGL